MLGGLAFDATSVGRTQVPGLGDLPLVGALFRSQTASEGSQSFYVFIRAVVLRDAATAQLAEFSRDAAHAAGLDGSHHPSPRTDAPTRNDGTPP